MKKGMWVLLIATAVFFFGCEGEQAAEPEVTEAVEEAPVVRTVSAVNVYPNIQTSIISGDPPTARGSGQRLDLGEVVTAFPDEALVSAFNLEMQRVIRADGSEVWANHRYQIENARPAVIIEEDFVYEGPDITQINQETRVPRTMIVAVVDDESNDDFFRIAWNDFSDPTQEYGRLRTSDYVRPDVVSFQAADLEVVRILEAAVGITNPQAKRTVLESGLDQRGSQLLDLVRDELDALDAAELEALQEAEAPVEEEPQAIPGEGSPSTEESGASETTETSEDETATESGQ